MMDFFEKAHVSKPNIVKKDSRSEEMVKKQLKQMLQGYKQSDNELIKSSGNVHRDIAEVHKSLDDSTSVSGFSDLDLTKSDDDDEETAATALEVGDVDASGSSQVNLNSTSSQEMSDDTNSEDTTNKTEQLEQSGELLEPISEGDEDIESLPEDLELTENASTSVDQSFSESSSCSESSSETFDPDGSLASKIRQNISKLKCYDPNSKKRKLDEFPELQKDRCREKMSGNKRLNKSRNKHKSVIEIESLSYQDSDEDSIEKLMENNTLDSVSTNASSPFISVTATEMSDHRLSDILGGYKHPTTQILPYEPLSANSTSLYGPEEAMQVDDAGSLVPEIGDEPLIEDIDVELDVTADSEPQTIKVEDTETKIPFKSVEKQLNESESNKFVNPVRVHYTDTCCIFVLQHPAEIYVNGKVKVKVLSGTVEVFGHILKKEVNLYSPNNNFAHCLKTKQAQNEYYGLFGKLTGAGLSIIKTEEIVTSLGEYDAVVAMTPLKDAKMEFVDNHFHADVFNRLKIDTNAHRLSQVSDRLSCNIYLSKPVRAFENYVSWDEELSFTLSK